MREAIPGHQSLRHQVILVVPVAVGGNPLLVLDFLVFPVSFGHRLCGQPFYAPVVAATLIGVGPVICRMVT